MIPEALLKANRALCESREPQPVREILAGAGLGLRLATTSTEKTQNSRKLHTCKLGQADLRNQNGRIYPREVWQAQIDRFNDGKDKSLLATGHLTGAVDHLSYFAGGNLGDTCIIHRELWMEDDGAVMAKYEIVESHSKGKDLKANKDAGMAIGWSTYGYGTAHEPSELERTRYGLGKDEYVVVMDANYMLKKADAVDDPSVEDAWDRRETKLARPETTLRDRLRETIAALESSNDYSGDEEEEDGEDEDDEVQDAIDHELQAAQAAVIEYARHVDRSRGSVTHERHS